MVYDIDMLRNFYANFPRRVDTIFIFVFYCKPFRKYIYL